MTDEDDRINCLTHGRSSITATVCCHQVRSETPVGFVENSNDPDDQQAWCCACDALFVKEGSLTRKFRKFCDFAVVCGKCYAAIKERHSKRSPN